MDVTIVTWVVAISGLVLIGLLGLLQLAALVRPRTPWTVKTVYGGDPGATDPTAYFAFNQGLAWADVLLWVPLQVAASVGMLLGQEWGFLLAIAASVPYVYSAIPLFIWDRRSGLPRGLLGHHLGDVASVRRRPGALRAGATGGARLEQPAPIAVAATTMKPRAIWRTPTILAGRGGRARVIRCMTISPMTASPPSTIAGARSTAAAAIATAARSPVSAGPGGASTPMDALHLRAYMRDGGDHARAQDRARPRRPGSRPHRPRAWPWGRLPRPPASPRPPA